MCSNSKLCKPGSSSSSNNHQPPGQTTCCYTCSSSSTKAHKALARRYHRDQPSRHNKCHSTWCHRQCNSSSKYNLGNA